MNLELLVSTILSLAAFAEINRQTLLELDVNPLLLTETECVAADVMIRETAQ